MAAERPAALPAPALWGERGPAERQAEDSLGGKSRPEPAGIFTKVRGKGKAGSRDCAGAAARRGSHCRSEGRTKRRNRKAPAGGAPLSACARRGGRGVRRSRRACALRTEGRRRGWRVWPSPGDSVVSPPTARRAPGSNIPWEGCSRRRRVAAGPLRCSPPPGSGRVGPLSSGPRPAAGPGGAEGAWPRRAGLWSRRGTALVSCPLESSGAGEKLGLWLVLLLGWGGGGGGGG